MSLMCVGRRLQESDIVSQGCWPDPYVEGNTTPTRTRPCFTFQSVWSSSWSRGVKRYCSISVQISIQYIRRALVADVSEIIEIYTLLKALFPIHYVPCKHVCSCVAAEAAHCSLTGCQSVCLWERERECERASGERQESASRSQAKSRCWDATI
jgi:hypothetical protein